MRDNDLSLEQGNFVVQTGYESWNRSSWVESDAIEYMLWGGIQMNVTVLWAVKGTGTKEGRGHNLWKFLPLEGRQVMRRS